MPDADRIPSITTQLSNITGILPTTDQHHLIVTTAKGVYAWNNHGSAELFSSNSNGIATALRIHTDKDLLAVADSQVVILHDVEKGRQNTYRLRKENQGQVRKLYYHPEQQRLYFTTTLQNAVQTFSLKTSELLDAAPVHPSPPTVFAVSPACDLLVSASTSPPTIYLSRIAYKQPPLLFIPNCSSSPVVAIAFHSNRPNVFALGFHDGTIAAYNATILPISQLTEERYSYARIYGEIAHIMRLHQAFIQSTSQSFEPGHPSTPSTISAVQFLEDRPCSVVTIGADGYCCIVDFERDGKKVSEVINRWHVKAPATSLAILRSEKLGIPQIDGSDDTNLSTAGIMVGIGMVDGTVGIYTHEGQLLAMRDFSTDGRILDLEWMERTKGKPKPANGSSPTLPETTVIHPSPELPRVGAYPQTPPALKNSRSGSKIMVRLHVKNRPSDDYLLRKETATPSIVDVEEKANSSLDGHSSPSLRENSAQEAAISDVKTEDRDGKPYSLDDGVLPKEDELESSNKNPSRKASNLTVSSRASRKSGKRTKTPVIPARPTPRPGGQLALRRMESAKARRASAARNSPVPKEIIQAAITGKPNFKNVSHTPHQRPKMHRRQTSHVSPFSEPAEPRFLSITPIKPLPVPAMGSPTNIRSPMGPIQFDRLVRTSWDAASITSTTRSSISRISVPRKEIASPASLNLAPVPIISPTKSHIKKNEYISSATAYTSDSGTSVSEVLDWSPAQVHSPASQPRGAPTNKNDRPFWDSSQPSSVKPIITPSQSLRNADSSSSVSRLDWNTAKLPKLTTSTAAAPAEKAQARVDMMSSISSPTTAQIPRPLSISRLRKQETVINLKDKKDKAVEEEAKKQDFVLAKPDFEEPVEAHKSSNGEPVRRVSVVPREFGIPIGFLKRDGIAQPVSSTLASGSLPALTPLPLSTQRSSTSPATRRSSQFAALPAFPTGSTIGSQSTYTIEDVIRIECAALATRMDVAFEEQKAWLQGFMREQNWYAQRLEEENRHFREELARLRKM